MESTFVGAIDHAAESLAALQQNDWQSPPP
jgi:hypothetical protein